MDSTFPRTPSLTPHPQSAAPSTPQTQTNSYSPNPNFTITHLQTASQLLTRLNSLTTILLECVNEACGSSLGFHTPLSSEDAEEYWRGLGGKLDGEGGGISLFILTASPVSPIPSNDVKPEVSKQTDPQILGTIQLLTSPKPTHHHRAEILKLLVLPSHRFQGIARCLMAFIEGYAKGIGKELLTLDTVKEGGAAEMYRRLGWRVWGEIRGYAEWGDGRRGDVVFFERRL